MSRGGVGGSIMINGLDDFPDCEISWSIKGVEIWSERRIMKSRDKSISGRGLMINAAWFSGKFQVGDFLWTGKFHSIDTSERRIVKFQD